MQIFFRTLVPGVFVLILLIHLPARQNTPEPETEPLFMIDATGKFSHEPGSYGYINAAGKVVFEPQYDHAYDFTEGLAFVKQGELFGCIDKSGRIVIETFKCAYPWPFSEGLAAVNVDGKWGFIDKSGKMVIAPQFSHITSFKEGFACVRLDNTWMVIDKKGDRFFADHAFGGQSFSEGLIAIIKDQKWGYLDNSGKVAIEPEYELVQPFAEGLAPVFRDNRWHYIDKSGQKAFDLEFVDATPFSEGLARVNLDYKVCYIDRTGAVTFERPEANANPFSEGMAAFRVVNADGALKWGFVDKSGKIVIAPKFEYAWDFSNGLARVQLGERWAYINKAGDYIWPEGFGEIP